MRKPIALACSDLHLYDWPQFNEDNRRLKVSYEFLITITNEARRLKIPILFPGDLYHLFNRIDNVTYNFFNHLFRRLDAENEVHIYGISGNHDLSEKNTKDIKSPSLFLGTCKAFPNLFKSVEFTKVEIGGINIMGIPYISHNVGFGELVESAKAHIKKGMSNILLIHCDVWGARDPSGREVNTVENIPRNLGKFFKGFDLVLSGHIHKYEKLWDNVYMVGAPYQQRKSDMGCKMGYLVIYDNYSVEFKTYNAPEFKTYDKEKNHPDTPDYWIPIIKEIKPVKESVREFSTNMSKEALAKQYLKAKGIKNQSKKKALIDILNKIDE